MEVPLPAATEPDYLTMEFYGIPEIPPLDEDTRVHEPCYVSRASGDSRTAREILDQKLGKQTIVNQGFEPGLRMQAIPSEARSSHATLLGKEPSEREQTATVDKRAPVPASTLEDLALFSTTGSVGILDLGATKTVIGSSWIQGMLEQLHPSIRSAV